MADIIPCGYASHLCSVFIWHCVTDLNTATDCMHSYLGQAFIAS